MEILGSFDLSLYQRRDCGALLDIFQKRNDYDFIEQYVWEEIIDEYLGKKHVQHEIGKEYLNKIFELVKKEVGRPKVRDIKNFISEMKNSDVDRLTAKIGHKIDTKIKISTIHKVKGLEFDTVFLMPSKKSFPLRGNNIRLLDHSAEEARLYFVAITRAKKQVIYGF